MYSILALTSRDWPKNPPDLCCSLFCSNNNINNVFFHKAVSKPAAHFTLGNVSCFIIQMFSFRSAKRFKAQLWLNVYENL